jgi:choline dehydrogenase-like flavoprotein
MAVWCLCQVRLQANAEGGYAHITAPLVNPEDVLTYDVFNAWGVLVPTAAALAKENIGNFRLILRFEQPDQAIVNINWEQVPNEASEITLHPTQTDPIFGQAVTHLDWRLRDEDKRTAVRALALAETYLRQHGAQQVELIPDLSGDAERWTFAPNEGALATGDHHMGALRMAAQPSQGIVTPDSRMHSVDNLYIAGCSVFPTGGFANPTLTIVALALRLADHLRNQ